MLKCWNATDCSPYMRGWWRKGERYLDYHEGKNLPAEQADEMFDARIKKGRSRGWTENSRKMMLKIWSNLQARTLLLPDMLSPPHRSENVSLGSIKAAASISFASKYIECSIYFGWSQQRHYYCLKLNKYKSSLI